MITCIIIQPSQTHLRLRGDCSVDVNVKIHFSTMEREISLIVEIIVDVVTVCTLYYVSTVGLFTNFFWGFSTTATKICEGKVYNGHAVELRE